MIKSTTIKDAPVFLEEKGVVAKLLNDEHGVIMLHLELAAKEALELHNMPMPVVFYVLSGNGALQTEDGEASYSVNSVVKVPAGILRAWKNLGDEPLQVLVIKISGDKEAAGYNPE